MRIRTKTRIDQVLGHPMVVVLNGLAYLLGKVMRRDHRMERTRVIVICKLVGIGSIVQSTPLATSLKRAFPTCRLILLTRKSNVAYTRLLPVIDEHVTLDDSSFARLIASTVPAVYALWRLRVDLFLNLEVHANLAALLTVISCARNRVGYYLRARDFGASGIYTHTVYFNDAAPIAEVYLQTARALGLVDLTSQLLAPVGFEGEAAALARRLRALDIADDRDFFVINPNASDLRLERRWPTGHWVAFLRELGRRHPDVPVLVIGGPGEESIARDIVRRVGAHPASLVNFAGSLSLGELAALLARARALITNDSGPMHIAFSLCTPTVALFGPVAPEHYGRSAEGRSVLVYRRLYCSPCVHHFLDPPCHGDNQCMQLISPHEVVDALLQLLAGGVASAGGAEHRYRDGAHVFGQRRRRTP